ncbi:hypothetical protein [Streptomyces sp. ALI-76-A]|uniref:hypothetical protein n=1 Tax=Streptomyces sp. ALI-76-A TaxID=3025736 RepID=UPI00256EA66B|nr:hypothetical protein [Streptomyces sp. ALI-76-A]MDL5198653.1 hypothetical protein [Streptomyces sp. ALI-76-A]
MPKNQSTAAQTARRASRSGAKYTEALRAATGDTPHAPHVLRFLAERSGNLYYLVGGIAAAWAHSGQRVLLLEEAEDYWRLSMSGARRSRGRRKKEIEPVTPPEPTTSTLREPGARPGRARAEGRQHLDLAAAAPPGLRHDHAGLQPVRYVVLGAGGEV